MKVIVRSVSLLFILPILALSACEEDTHYEQAQGESHYEREVVSSKHVGWYVGEDAQDVCDTYGKAHQFNLTYQNYANYYDFNIYSSNSEVKAELVCRHVYHTRVFLTTHKKIVETRPAVYLLSKKYNKRKLQSLKLIERELLDIE